MLELKALRRFSSPLAFADTTPFTERCTIMAVLNLPDWMTPREFKSPVVRKYTLKQSAPQPGGANTNIDYERDLNPQQRQVVLAPAGPLLVIAGAGSGKTHTLTYRVAHLVERGTPADRIMLLTFTNKASRAMIDRVSAILGDGVKRIWGGTFHSMANRILRLDGELLGYAKDFTILDGEDTSTLMRVCLNEAEVDRAKRLPKAKLLVNIHSACVNTQRPLLEVLRERYPYFLEQLPAIRAILELYRDRKFEMSVMDFDDLLLNWKRLLVEFPDRLDYWANRFDHLLVDEYQDTNQLQGELIDMMASSHRNVMVVGDDCQSIYAFRGANYLNILEFPERYEGCQQYRLEINYRSTPQVLELANRSIAHNAHQFQKTLQASRPQGPKPALVAVRDVYQQAEFVCQRVLDLLEEEVALGEIAVMYRSHFHSMELQVELTKRNIPYVVRSGVRFFEQAHIKDVLAYLKFLYNPKDELSFMRLAQQWQGLGPKRAQALWEPVQASASPLDVALSEALLEALPERAAEGWRQARQILLRQRALPQGSSPGELIELVLEGGYEAILRSAFDNAENRLADLTQMAQYAAQYGSLDEFLSEISLLTTLTGQDIASGHEEPDEYLCLTSIHQAKGLEWSACFVLGLAEGLFPSQYSSDDEAQLEEERRLFYVAATRARDDLYLCHPFSHTLRGKGTTFLRASPFVTELEDHDRPEREPWERWVIEGG